MHVDPHWPRASDWLAQGTGGDLTVVGCPTNVSVTPGRYDLGPDAIRAALARYSTHDFASGADIRTIGVRDAGNMVRPITGKTVILGGDNGATRIGVRALGVPLDRVGVITVDAHLDLRTLDTGPMNGNPIRGLLADGVLGYNIAQLGLQSFANSPAYAEVGRGAEIIQHTVEECREQGFAKLFASVLNRIAHHVDAIYVDIDLDAMDRAFAPGCPGSRPGGLLPSDLFVAARLSGRHVKVVAMDIVELDPTLDQQDRTAMTGARCLLEFAAGMAEAIR